MTVERTTVVGFVVVRLPHRNQHVVQQVVTPQIDGCYYAGIDRLPWVDVFDEDFYKGEMPEAISRLANDLEAYNRDRTGITVCADAEVAFRLLEYANRRGISNELIVVRSPELEVHKGKVDVDLSVEWLGYDVVGLREWSLISAGIFMFPDYYCSWIPRINSFGLLDDSSLMSQLAEAYDRASVEGKSEPLGPVDAGLSTIAIEVGRIVVGGSRPNSQVC